MVYHKTHYRSLFLSDFHIGAKTFDANALNRFLKQSSCEHLYLVGDIIDGWKLNKRWYWTKECTKVLETLIRMRNEGTKITYLPGNHDEEVRRFNLLARYDVARRLKITIKDKIIHSLADGRRILVLHGDQFDNAILKGPLSRWSDRFYDWLTEKLQTQERPHIIINGKRKPFSLAKSLKKSGQWALQLINNFEYTVTKQASRHQVDGLICGHTHIPMLKNLNGTLYANCGSWVGKTHTALTEDETGKLSLIDIPGTTSPDPFFAPEMFPEIFPETQLETVSPKEKRSAEKIVALIHSIWPEDIKDEKPTKHVPLTPSLKAQNFIAKRLKNA